MARPARRVAGRLSALRESIAARAVAHAGHWPSPAATERAEQTARAARGGVPMVLDAPTLHGVLFAIGDTRAKEFRHDRHDPADARRWLLTEHDDLIGPLSPAQLAELV
jgi:hypothetical protein